MPRMMAKMTTPVPSLKTLSPSTRVDSFFGTPSLLKVARTETGSVGDIMAPKRRARGRSMPVSAFIR